MLSSRIDGGVALIELDRPPVNALGRAMRGALERSLREAAEDTSVRAIVLTGVGKGFSGGADIAELSDADTHGDASELLGWIEAQPKPIVAALHGFALGGGLELALACHARIAHVETRIGLPEITLGLVPGAGGTQRLPRLIGVEAALDMILSGKPQRADAWRGSDLFDGFVDTTGDLVPAARAHALALAESGGLPRTRDREAAMPDGEAFLAVARAAVTAQPNAGPAPAAVVDCLRAALTGSFEEGLRKERELFDALCRSWQSAGLRHVFMAERAAGQSGSPPAGGDCAPIKSVGVIGAGTMGAGIAMTFANAGMAVVLVERDQAALDRGLQNIRRDYQASVEKGRLAQDEAERRLQRIAPALTFAALADVDLVVEAAFEDMALKQDIFARLDAAAKPGAILATNTSMLDVDAIAAATRRPQDVLGLHFFSPAHVMKLLEVVQGERTAPETLASAVQLARRIGKTAVVARVCDGFIGNRMLEPYIMQAGMLLDEGALPAQVDGAMERWGMAMGPFRMLDLAGNDLAARIRAHRRVAYPDLPYSEIFDTVLAMERLGLKAGKGWHDYADGRRPKPSREVEAAVAAESKRLGLERRRIADEEIVDRLLLALINEGARILEEKVARRSSDIDVVYTSGYGFPRARGGPMFAADRRGLSGVLDAIRRLAKGPAYQRPEIFWQPAPLLVRLAQGGGRFGDLDIGTFA